MTYPLPILNELHELYPDLLYRPSRFESSRDVVQYILEQSIYRPHQEELARYQAEQSHHEQHQVLEERIARARNSQESQSPAVPSAPVSTVVSSHIVQVSEPSAHTLARASRAPIPAEVLHASMPLTQQQRRSIEDFERALYGGIVYNPPSENISLSAIPAHIAQATSFEQLLAAVIDDGIIQSRSRHTSHRPTAAQLDRATTVRTLIENHDGVCSICHEELTEGQQARQIHHCNHLFHQFCIDTWFSMRSTCPTCRHDIRSS